MKQKNNMKFLCVTLGIIATALVVIAVVLVMNTVTNMKDKQSVSNEQTATEENSSAPTPAARTSQTSQTGNPDTAASDESGMYAGQTEPTETPVDIYYVENNFDAEACDIKPTVSEEGWYIENVGCLEGCPWACMYSDEKGVYDEGRIRAFENAVFEKIRYFSDSYEDISSVSRITIDTRTVPDEKNPNRHMVLSFNTSNNEGILIGDFGDVIGAVSTVISEKPEIFVNEGKDYIRNLDALVGRENEWSYEMIEKMQQALFDMLNEYKLHPGMMVINQGLVKYDDETNEYSIMIQQYSDEDYLIHVIYNADTDKFKIVLLGVDEANEKK